LFGTIKKMKKIAILAWGSVYWDPRRLPLDKDGNHNIQWGKDGPSLQLEFSRISGDSRLTLVIDETNGRSTLTLYAFSKRNCVEDAVADLRDREGTILKNIGFSDLKRRINSKNKYIDQPDVFDKIEQWAQERDIDAVVWTALKSNFQKETKMEYNLDNASKYLERLPANVKMKAKEYIEKAPEQISTAFRDRFNSNNKG